MAIGAEETDRESLCGRPSGCDMPTSDRADNPAQRRRPGRPDSLLFRREQLNARLQTIIAEQTEPSGVKVTIVEVKDVELPHSGAE